MGATKLAVFAYDRKTKKPMWQSGIATSMTNAKDYWFLGVGPIQRGSVYGGTRFAGDPLKPFDPVAIARNIPETATGLRRETLRSSAHETELDPHVAPVGFKQPFNLPLPPLQSREPRVNDSKQGSLLAQP